MYTVDYFISKVEAIPDAKIITEGLFDGFGGYCFNGWCGVKDCREPTIESAALQKILSPLKITWFGHGDTPITSNWDYEGYSIKAVYINNGWTNEYQQPTPKQRILAALQDIKRMQQPQYHDIRKDLATFEIGDKTDLPVLSLAKNI